MTNRNFGQIRVGKSGPIIIGEGNEPQQSLEMPEKESEESETISKEEDLVFKKLNLEG